MAFIDYCKKDAQSAMITAVCISKEESAVLLPVVKKEVEKARKAVDHYEDLISDGYGTTLQATLLVKWQKKLDTLESIEHALNGLLQG